MIKLINPFVRGLFVGSALTLSFFVFVAAISNNSKVVAVQLVKPGILGFEPVNGSSIGNTWNKRDVVAMCEVKPGIVGFVPVNGSSIGNVWYK